MANIDILPQKILLFKGFWWFSKREESKKYERSLRSKYRFEALAEKKMNSGETYGFYLLTQKRQ